MFSVFPNTLTRLLTLAVAVVVPATPVVAALQGPTCRVLHPAACAACCAVSGGLAGRGTDGRCMRSVGSCMRSVGTRTFAGGSCCCCHPQRSPDSPESSSLQPGPHEMLTRDCQCQPANELPARVPETNRTAVSSEAMIAVVSYDDAALTELGRSPSISLPHALALCSLSQRHSLLCRWRA